MTNHVLDIYRSSRKVLVLIGIIHVVLILVTLSLLYELNLKDNGEVLLASNKVVMINASLLGFLGSLFFFSRKVYIYLITDKFSRLVQAPKENNSDYDNNKVKSMIIGYYIYLSTRPIAGLIIGPLLQMFVLAGLTTFSKTAVSPEVSISLAGMYLIYILSFIGGYSSSDLFDYFSTLGTKLIKKIDLK